MNPPSQARPRGTLAAGFSCAVAASVCWGLGNVVTRWTAMQYPASPLDISLAKYLVAGATITTIGALLVTLGPKLESPALLPARRHWALFLLATTAKALDTYLWHLAAVRIPAVQVATLNNLQMFWTAAALTILLHRPVSVAWLCGSLLLFFATWLITRAEWTLSNAPGLTYALLSSLAFSVFMLAWRPPPADSPLGRRALSTGFFLLTTALFIYPVHLVFRLFDTTLPLAPLLSTPLGHLAVQSLNGLLGIGATYFLAHEASCLCAASSARN